MERDHSAGAAGQGGETQPLPTWSCGRRRLAGLGCARLGRNPARGASQAGGGGSCFGKGADFALPHLHFHSHPRFWTGPGKRKGWGGDVLAFFGFPEPAACEGPRPLPRAAHSQASWCGGRTLGFCFCFWGEGSVLFFSPHQGGFMRKRQRSFLTEGLSLFARVAAKEPQAASSRSCC